MDDLAEFKQTYFQECEELLADLEGQLTALQDGETDDEILNAAFRAIHSIKGGAGAFGFTQLVSFAHVFETVLDLMREHRLEKQQHQRHAPDPGRRRSCGPRRCCSAG